MDRDRFIAELISSSAVIVVIVILLWYSGVFTPAVDCEVAEWGPCDPITGKRIRTIVKDRQGTGKACGALEEDCPVDCVTSSWGPCVDGVQKRTILSLAKNGGKECEALERKGCVVPFSEGSTLTTDPQTYQNIRYLDRHPQLCPGKPINSFQVNKSEVAGQVKIDYKCAENLDAGEKISKNSKLIAGYTPANLAVAPIECGPGEVISNYGLKRETDGYKFKYDCIKSTKNLTCKELSTTPSADITAHNIQCSPDEVLSSLKVKDTGKGLISYIYNCCKKVLPAL